MPENMINFGQEFVTNDDFSPIADGDYEVKIDKAEVRISKAGKRYLNFSFKIREDVEQNFKRRRVFMPVYQNSKDPNDAAINFPVLNLIILTQEGTPDYQRNFQDLDEVLLYLNGKNLIITVMTEFDDYSGEDRNIVKPKSFRKSEADSTSTGATVITAETVKPKLELPPDDELPF